MYNSWVGVPAREFVSSVCCMYVPRTVFFLRMFPRFVSRHEQADTYMPVRDGRSFPRMCPRFVSRHEQADTYVPVRDGRSFPSVFANTQVLITDQHTK